MSNLPAFVAGGTVVGTSVPLTGGSVGQFMLLNLRSSTSVPSGGGSWAQIGVDATHGVSVWGAVLTSVASPVTLSVSTAAVWGFYSSCAGAQFGGIGVSSTTTSVAVPATAGVYDEQLVVACGYTSSGSATVWSVPAGWTLREQQLLSAGNGVMIADRGANSLDAQTLSPTATFTLTVAPTVSGTVMMVVLSKQIINVTATATVTIGLGANPARKPVGAGLPRIIYEAAFAANPNTSSPPFWTDISDRVLGFAADRGRQWELAQANPGMGQMLLLNNDGALDPANASSPYYPNVVPMRRTRVTAIWNNVAYPVWAGNVQTWPQQWDDSHLGQNPATLIDALSNLGGGLLPVLASAMKASNPWHLWPLNETPSTPASGSTTWQFSDEGATSVPLSLTIVAPTGGATISNGATLPTSLAAVAADTAEGVKIDCGVGAYLTAFAGTAADGVSLFPKTGEIVTWEFFGSSQDLTASSAHAVLLAINDGVTEWLRVEAWESSVQFPRVTVNDTAGNTLQWPAVVSAPDPWNTSPEVNRHWVITLDGTGGVLTLTIRIDGTIWLRQVVLPFVLPSSTVTHLNVNGDNFVATRGVGIVSAAAMYQRYLGAAEMADHASAYGGFPGDLAGARAARIFDWADWNAPTAIDVGTSTMAAAAGLGGGVLGGVLQQTADSDFGQIFVDKSGNLTFAGRARLSTVTPACTFGDNGTTEIPYLGDLAFVLDPTYVYDRVSVTRTTGTIATVRNPTTTDTYYPNTLVRTIGTDNDADAFAQATYLAAAYAAAKQRVSNITIDMFALFAWDNAHATTFASTVLGLEIGSVATVTRRSATTVTGNFRIEAVSDQITPASWDRGFQLSPVLPVPTW